MSTKTNTSNLETTYHNSSLSVENEEDGITEEIDWARYLKEGQEEFFHNYGSDNESVRVPFIYSYFNKNNKSFTIVDIF